MKALLQDMWFLAEQLGLNHAAGDKGLGPGTLRWTMLRKRSDEQIHLQRVDSHYHMPAMIIHDRRRDLTNKPPRGRTGLQTRCPDAEKPQKIVANGSECQSPLSGEIRFPSPLVSMCAMALAAD